MSDRLKAVLFGVAVGGAVGALLGWLASDAYEDASANENPIRALGPGDYLALGVSILTLARQFGGMLKRT